MESIEFLAHGFVIIDLVPDEEMQTARHIEENLLDEINAGNSGLFCERHKCETKNDLIDVFNKIKKRLKEKEEVSYIHIEGHGSKESLKLLDSSLIPWSSIFEHFREINILCKNNLFFSSGACQSAYALKAATITKPSPIFGMLAPEQEVEAGSVLDGYIAFYKSLIRNESLNEAFKAFADVTNGKQYALIFSQSLFKKAAYKYITKNCMGKGRRERLESVLTQAVSSKDVQVKQTRKLLKKELNKPQARSLKKFHNTFMMIDIYPENSKRFEFDAVKFEQKIKSGELKIV
jgi:hypothetical protein